MMNVDEIRGFLAVEFPQSSAVVDSAEYGAATVSQPVAFRHLRPGNTVSGPTLMELADCAIFVAIQSSIGPEPLAVTTNLNINFLRKPARDADIVAKAKLIKIGKRLVIGDVLLYSVGSDAPVAHVTATYSVPPR